ncbi:hypothetical protein [Microbulbifer sp. TRSA007]|uniref:hypothetical protein n=1 Tax=Microbulbifer sp. TRSA007 TaxID=3243384 RepID=UPI00403A6043
MAAERKLTDLKRFWYALGAPIASCLIASIVIIFNSDLQWDFSHKGFNDFHQIFRIPLAILALALPIVALVATIHRSAQLSETLKRAEIQNTFANYYTHRKEFLELLKQLEVDHGISFSGRAGLYAKIFPNNNNQSLETVSTGKNQEESLLFELARKFLRAKEITKHSKVTNEKVNAFYLNTYNLSNELHFTVVDGKGRGCELDFVGNPEPLKIQLAYEENNPFKHLYIVGSVLEALRDFGHIESPRTFTFPNINSVFSSLASQKFKNQTARHEHE